MMSIMKRQTPLLLLVVLIVLHRVESACLFTAPPTGNAGNVCEYNGVQYKPGSHRIEAECLDCTCNADGSMRCCGYGVHAGVFQIPSGCKMRLHEDGCNGHMVKTDDETQPCDFQILIG